MKQQYGHGRECWGLHGREVCRDILCGDNPSHSFSFCSPFHMLPPRRRAGGLALPFALSVGGGIVFFEFSSVNVGQPLVCQTWGGL